MLIGFDGRVLVHPVYTGVEIFANHVYKELRKINNVVLFKPKTKNRYLQHLWTYFHLPQLCKEKNVDVLFCTASAAPFSKKLDIRLVVTIHDISYIRHPKMYSLQFRSYYKSVIGKIIERADAITTVSFHEKNFIETTFNDSIGKIRVVYPGISNDYRFMNLDREDIILTVGSLNRHKNLIGIIKAFKFIMNDIPHNLVIVGNKRKIISNDDQLSGIMGEIPKERVIFTGYIDRNKLVELYNRSKLFITASLFEGFGVTPIEAMACGCPVLASKYPSIAEACGDSAIYFNQYDSDELSKKILETLGNETLQSQLIEKGINWSRNFNFRKTAQELNKIFLSLA